MSKIAGRPIVPAIRVPEDGLGPCMLALAPAMRAFVYAKVVGGMNNKNAAGAAGYSTNGESAKVVGYKLAHREDVQAAIAEESRKLMRTEGPRSIRTLITLRDKARDERVRLKAAEALLDRCGLGTVSQSHLTVDHNVRLTDEQQDRRIIELCKELGLGETEARKLLISPDAIDAEFEEVAPAEPATPEEIERRAELDHANTLRRLREAMTPEELAEHKRQMLELRSAAMKARYQAAQQPGPFSETGVPE